MKFIPNTTFAGIADVFGSRSKTRIESATVNTNNVSIQEANRQSEEIFVVAVDSREKSTSDLACYREVSCDPAFFQVHVHDDPKNIQVKSQVAELCGLDMKLCFHDHSHPHHRNESPMGHTNDIATLLTFDPETGRCNNLVGGKAYILLDDGRRPISKRQVWELVEMIREVKKLYERIGEEHPEERENRRRHFGDYVEEPSPSPMLQAAYLQLLTWCTQYREGTWVPHSPGDGRHPTTHHRRHGRHHHHGKENPHRHDHVGRSDSSSGAVAKDACHCSAKLRKQESGNSDAATCNHGACHHHHDVTIKTD